VKEYFKSVYANSYKIALVPTLAGYSTETGKIAWMNSNYTTIELLQSKHGDDLIIVDRKGSLLTDDSSKEQYFGHLMGNLVFRNARRINDHNALQ
jgi:hypothetical protein